MKRSTSLSTRITLTLVAIASLSILLLSIIIGYRSTNIVEEEIGNALGETAHIMSNQLDQYMWSRYENVQLLSNIADLRKPKSQDETRLLVTKLKENFSAFSWIGFANRDGIVVISTGEIPVGADISEDPAFKNAQEKPFIDDVHEAVHLPDLLRNPSGEEIQFVGISTPVRNGQGEFIGVLVTHLSYERLREVRTTFTETLKNPENTEIFIVSHDHNDIIIGPDASVGQTLDLESVELAQLGKKGWTNELWPDNKKYLTGYIQSAGYDDYPGLGWTILIRQPMSAAYGPVRELMRYIASAGIIFVIISAIIGKFIAGRISSPLMNITKVANELRAGEKVSIPKQSGITEIEILSDSLQKLVTDLTSTETELLQMESQVKHDHLTGLPNRYALDSYLENAELHYPVVTILFLDLDGFKAINDRYGHDTGDQLLKQVGMRLQSSVNAGELVARIGGDEFILVLTATENPHANAVMMGEHVMSKVNKPFYLKDVTVSIGCSIGGAVWHSGENIRNVIRTADEALYHVKRTGKNRVNVLEDNR
ncbi:sensor domain-containing diguanylate cyclase [Sporosarcina sp. FA9]|uniref:sensor domain-containing diguanylate cyclase n=1 Tax=Sporosarcina sp. FA9 TaxID=3413030 RepID=UPI003F6573E7